jgi:hypothetical protein
MLYIPASDRMFDSIMKVLVNEVKEIAVVSGKICGAYLKLGTPSQVSCNVSYGMIALFIGSNIV